MNKEQTPKEETSSERFKIIPNNISSVWNGSDELYHIIPSGFEDTYLVIDGGPHFSGEVKNMTLNQVIEKFGVVFNSKPNKSFLDVLQENYEAVLRENKNAGRTLRKSLAREYEDLIAIYKSNYNSAGPKWLSLEPLQEAAEKYATENISDKNDFAEFEGLENAFKAGRDWQSKQPQQGVDDWISVKDRLPTKEDCFDDYGEVLTIQVGRKRPTMMKFWEVKDCPFTKLWMKVPSLPNPTPEPKEQIK